MVRNSKAGNKERAARYRERLRERGYRELLLVAPEEARPLLKRAAELMTRDEDPLTPASALRIAAGGNEPPELLPIPEKSPGAAENLARLAELEAALEAERLRAETAEREREAERLRALAVEAELAGERERAAEAESRAEAATTRASRAATAAKTWRSKAEAAEAKIEAVTQVPGLRGKALRLLAGDLLRD